MGAVTRGGRDCDVWQNITQVGEKKNVYTMWVERSSNHPVRYEMQGFDSLLGSHYDKYYLEYDGYSTDFSDDVFKVPQGEHWWLNTKLQCIRNGVTAVLHQAFIMS